MSGLTPPTRGDEGRQHEPAGRAAAGDALPPNSPSVARRPENYELSPAGSPEGDAQGGQRQDNAGPQDATQPNAAEVGALIALAADATFDTTTKRWRDPISGKLVARKYVAAARAMSGGMPPEEEEA